MKLIEDYESRMAGCKKKKITNERVANSLYIVSFIASAVATVFVAAGAGPKELVAVLAAIPAIVTLALSIFKPDGRSQWWAAKYGKLDDLVRAIKYEKMSESDASKALTSFLETHEPKYPGLGSPASGSAA